MTYPICVEERDRNIILCHPDMDMDGFGCDGAYVEDCYYGDGGRILKLCPDYNYVCENNETLECYESYENTCPCPYSDSIPNYSCYQIPENGLDPFETCPGFLDACQNPHCSQIVNDDSC